MWSACCGCTASSASRGSTRKGWSPRLTSPPLRALAYHAGFGTLYTAAYRPARGSAGYHWPGSSSWQQSFDDFQEGERWIKLADEVKAPSSTSRPSASRCSGITIGGRKRSTLP